MQIGIDAFDVAKSNWFVQQLLVERSRKASVQTMTVKDCNAQYASHEMEIR